MKEYAFASAFLLTTISVCISGKFYYVPHRMGGGHIAFFGADPVGVGVSVGVSVGVGVTLCCMHDIS